MNAKVLKAKSGHGSGTSRTRRNAVRSIAREELQARRKALEQLFAFQLNNASCEGWERQVKFHPVRRWRFDFAWLDCKVAVEIDGGTFNGGRHVTGVGHQNDVEKQNAAVELGWTVLRFNCKHVHSGQALAQVERILEAKRLGNMA